MVEQDIFSGIEEAKNSSEKLPNIQPGKYLLQVDALKKITSRKNVPYTVGEFTVVERQSETGNAKGSRCAVLIRMDSDYALTNVKNMFSAAMGEPDTALTKQKANVLISPNNPAKGRKVMLDAFDITKKDGRPFTKCLFSPYVEAPTKK